MFSDTESNHICSQRLARLATVSSKGQPDVVPVGFEYDGKYFWIGSGAQEVFLMTKKYKSENTDKDKLRCVIDDLKSANQ